MSDFSREATDLTRDGETQLPLQADMSIEEDWEAIADREPDELLSSQVLPEVSKLSLEDTKGQTPKRRGRGTFSYKKDELYSDQIPDKLIIDMREDEDVCHNLEGDPKIRNSLEARNCIRCAMKVRVLDENDTLLSSISPKDLEPPRQRPQTSVRTAQRLIAHGMGLKLPSTAFGSVDLKKQEDDRKSRIVMRQKLKDDAWGTDEN
ncbi:hypothetical protein PRUPE_7G038700 [Prunus persica]|uniref:Uncharacterized protein n=1 Tax=Prunus persica TaxID=3760 RepID=A0A251N6E9_PRUPE|nr:hypothetical protein PRUPE_7G038700 [Prunus persica]